MTSVLHTVDLPAWILPADGPVVERGIVWTPERKLLEAILLDAIHVVFDMKKAKYRWLVRETKEWIRSRDTDWVFSFENVCSEIGCDATSVRKVLLATL